MQIEVIDPKRTAMIVVDMQNDFVAPGVETPAARAVVPKLAEALNICHAGDPRGLKGTGDVGQRPERAHIAT